MENQALPYVVLDNGTGNCRIGYAGEDYPRITM